MTLIFAWLVGCIAFLLGREYQKWVIRRALKKFKEDPHINYNEYTFQREVPPAREALRPKWPEDFE